MTPKSGLRLKGDVGVLFGDGGKQTVFRQYWSNKASGLVNDVPGEADLDSKAWRVPHPQTLPPCETELRSAIA